MTLGQTVGNLIGSAETQPEAQQNAQAQATIDGLQAVAGMTVQPIVTP